MRVAQFAGSRAQDDGTIPVAEHAKSALCNGRAPGNTASTVRACSSMSPSLNVPVAQEEWSPLAVRPHKLKQGSSEVNLLHGAWAVSQREP